MNIKGFLIAIFLIILVGIPLMGKYQQSYDQGLAQEAAQEKERRRPEELNSLAISMHGSAKGYTPAAMEFVGESTDIRVPRQQKLKFIPASQNYHRDEVCAIRAHPNGASLGETRIASLGIGVTTVSGPGGGVTIVSEILNEPVARGAIPCPQCYSDVYDAYKRKNQ